MKKKSLLITLLLTGLYIPEVYAATCPLGKDVTQDLANILNIIQILGPIIVIVVTAIEVAKTVSKGNIQEESKKLGIRLLKRVLYCIMLFFIPVIVKTGASIAQIDVSSCDLSNPTANNYSVSTKETKTLTTESKTKALQSSTNKGNTSSSGSYSGGTHSIEYVNIAINMANDDSIGYRNEVGYNLLNPDVDCGTFVSYALQKAGILPSGTIYEPNERYGNSWSWGTVLEGAGFTCSAFPGIASCQDGDILIRSGHTEMYIGNNQQVGAHWNYGNTAGGDQDGNEVCVVAASENWEYVCRK